MASAPFTLNITIPGDTDVVSQFPGVDRTHLDIINSWIRTDHNRSGTHKWVTFLQTNIADAAGDMAGTPSVASNNSAIYRDTDKALKVQNGDDASVEFLGGVPPGVIMAYGGATLPTGWLWCDGSAVSRSTYARLFTAITSNFGNGDGSTTFNVPDLNGRVIIGRDRSGSGRVTTAGSAIDGATLAASGGAQNHVLVVGELPTHNHTVTDPGHIHTETVGASASGGALGVQGGAVITGVTTNPVMSTISGTTGITLATAGSDTAHPNMPPGLVINYIIRT